MILFATWAELLLSSSLVFLGLFLISLPLVLTSPVLMPGSRREAAQYLAGLFMVSLILVMLSA